MALWGLFGGKDKVDLGGPLKSLANVRLQVFREDYLGIKVLDRTTMAVRPLAPGLVQALVEDVGGGERIFGWNHVASFGKSQDELFELARVQTAKLDDHIAKQIIDAIQVYACNGFYLSGKLLDVFRDPTRMKKGVVIAPVTWHHWCAHVIQSGLTVPPHLSMLRLIAGDLGAAAKVTDAERLTGDLYWVRPGGTQIDRIEVRGDEPVISPELEQAMAW